MGITYCANHGRQGICEVCVHLDLELKNNNPKKIYVVPLYGTRVCELCFSKLDLEEFKHLDFDFFLNMKIDDQEALLIDEKIGSQHDRIKTKIWCVKCFNEIVRD